MSRTEQRIMFLFSILAATATMILLVYLYVEKSMSYTQLLSICVAIVFTISCGAFVYIIIADRTKLARRNACLEKSLVSSGTSVWQYDVDTDRFETILGSPLCNRSGVVMHDLINMVDRQDRLMASKEIESVISGKRRSTSFTARCVLGGSDESGDYYKFDVIAGNEPGKPIKKIIGTERNVSLDKLSDFEYQNIIMLLNLSIKASGMLVWYYDVDSDMIYRLNDNRFIPIQNIHDFIVRAVIPEERNFCTHLYNNLMAGKLEYFNGNIDLRNINGPGRGTFACSFTSMKNERGKVIKLAGTCQDITEKHREHLIAAEGNKRFTLAMKTSNFVLWEYDCESQLFTAYNEPLNHFDDKVKLGIIDYIKYLHPDDVNKMANLNEHLSMRHDVDFSMELRFKDRKNGEWQFYTFTGAPFEKDKYGNVTKFAGVRKNNTHFMKFNEELKRAKEKAEKSDKLKTQFIANMTHEIRTPLNSIVGFTQLLQSTDDKESLANLCRIINDNSAMLLSIFNNVINLSDLESGVITFNKVQLDMAQQFDIMKDIFKHKMPEDVELVLDSPYSSFVATLDWDRIVQIYTHFVNNACKNTSHGSITIGYRAHEDGMQLFCRDTGKGIAIEDQKRIFMSFEKVDSYVQGLGLGLSICVALVNSLGGRIGVQSELGVGSLFWATIPCTPEYKIKNFQSKSL